MKVPIEQIEAAKTGGRAEIESLLEAVWPDAYRLAKTILPGDCSAEDVAQDACVTMYRSIASLKDARAFSTWFYRIVVHQALKQKKLQRAQAPLSDEASYDKDCAGLVDLLRALRTLPDKLRAVIVLHYFEELTTREIAAILRVPDATVRFRLMTARRRLEPLLQARESSGQSKGESIYAL